MPGTGMTSRAVAQDATRAIPPDGGMLDVSASLPPRPMPERRAAAASGAFGGRELPAPAAGRAPGMPKTLGAGTCRALPAGSAARMSPAAPGAGTLAGPPDLLLLTLPDAGSGQLAIPALSASVLSASMLRRSKLVLPLSTRLLMRFRADTLPFRSIA